MWSIHDIEVLFHLRTTISDWPNGVTPALMESTRRLQAAGLIVLPEPDMPFILTPKGEAFIQILLATPVPVAVEKFVDPRFEKTT